MLLLFKFEIDVWNDFNILRLNVGLMWTHEIGQKTFLYFFICMQL